MADASGGQILWNLDVDDAQFQETLNQASASAKEFGGVVDTTGAEASDAFDSMTASAKVSGDAIAGAGEKAAATAPEVAASGDAAKGASIGFEGLTDSIKETLIPLAAMFVGYKAFEDIFKEVNDDTNLYNSAQAQLTNTLQNTKDAVGLTIGQLDAMADATTKGTTFTAAANLQAESTLLNYKEIGSTVFPLAVGQIDNLATAMANIQGRPVASLQDASTASKLLGKALEDPATGVDALTRVGIKFSAQQVAQIKTMQASGDTIGAQKQFISDLSDTISGKATAATETYQGRIMLLQKSVYELGTQYIKELQKDVEKLGDDFLIASQWVSQHTVVLDMLKGVLIAVAIFGVVALTTVVYGLIASFVAAAAPFLIAGAAIGLLADKMGGFKNLADKIKGPLDDIKTALGFIFETITGGDPTITAHQKNWSGFVSFLVNDVQPALQDIETFFSLVFQVMTGGDPTISASQTQFEGIVKALDDIKQVVTEVVDVVGKVLVDAWKILKQAIDGLMPSIKSLIGAFITQLKPIVTEIYQAFVRLWQALNPALMDTLKVLAIIIGLTLYGAIYIAINALRIGIDVFGFLVLAITDVIKWVADLITWIGDIIVFIVKFDIQFLETIAHIAVSIATDGANILLWFLNLPGKILGLFAGAVSWLWNVGTNIVSGLANGIVAVASDVWNGIKKVSDQIGDFFAGAANWLYDVGKDIVDGLARGISDAIGDITKAAGKISSAVQSTVKNLLGIHSPSTVFAEIGKNIGAGLVNGINASQADVNDAMSNLTGNMSANVNVGSQVDVSGTMSNGTASAIAGSQTGTSGASSSPQVNVTLNPSGIIARSRSDLRAITKDMLNSVDEELKARRLPTILPSNTTGSSTA